MKRILVGVDGSAHADRAICVAAKIAKASGADLTLLAVRSLPQAIESGERASLEESHDALVDLRPPFLKRAKEKAALAGAPGVETAAAVGDPAEEIVNAARRRQADVIVVGRRGRGRVTSLVFGSVSQKTIHLAGCPVMIVP